MIAVFWPVSDLLTDAAALLSDSDFVAGNNGGIDDRHGPAFQARIG